jgi:hypothetical protein
MKIKELFESQYKVVSLDEIQPTEDWNRPLNKTLFRALPAVKEYYDKIEHGESIPPLEVSLISKAPIEYRQEAVPPLPGKKYYLHNGHHRFAAATLAGLKTVRVKITKHRWT